jgi:DNA-binding IclR family transcriptional regulator
MKPESAAALLGASAPGRSLSTARAVLQVLSLLIEHPEGVRVQAVAEELAKSTSTAYYLLTSLCEEGFAVHESRGVYRVARGLERLTGLPEPTSILHSGLESSVDELFLLTRKRSYLGVARRDCIEIVAFHGRQGVPRMPGLGTKIRDNAHALAMGKVVLSLLAGRGLARYCARGLKSFTPHTITAPDVLAHELQRVRHDGYAVDREEFDENFCCVAAPIFDSGGRFVAALGLSTTAHIFDADREHLAHAVRGVARRATARVTARPTSPATRRDLQAVAENRRFLAGHTS